MTQEEKAKTYDEMVQRVKELHEAGNALTKKQMEIICPELAESGDEKTAWEIKNFILYKAGHLLDEETEHRFIKYLKKQEEQKPVEHKDFEEWVEDYWSHNKVNNPYSYNNGDEIQFDHKGFVSFCEAYCYPQNLVLHDTFAYEDGRQTGRNEGVKLVLNNPEKYGLQKEQKPTNEGNMHEPTLDEARQWNEAYEKGYSLGYENGRNEKKPVKCLDKDKVYAIMTKLTNLSYSQLIPINSDEYKKIDEITSDMLDLIENPIEQKPIKWDELTWKDINDLESIMNEVHSDFRAGIGEKNFGLEVLERFRYIKDDKNLDATEPKFKVGDEIRLIDGKYEDTVLEVLSGGSYRLKNLGLLSIPENEWELVNAPVDGYELIDKKEQKSTEKQDYSGLTEFEQIIHRGFLCAGAENVPVVLIKETAQECLTQMQSTEWSEEDEGELQNAIDALEFLGKKGIYKSESGYDAALQAASWLKNLPERFVLQQKQELSKEDKKNIFIIKNALRDAKLEAKEESESNGVEINVKDFENAELWLKSLRPQPHTVSMENANKFANLEYERGIKDGLNQHWKPSEEQMKQLENAMMLSEFGPMVTTKKQYPALESLYNDLKKLL